jgi:succinate dehydrogenase / fumarate reductase cytochrome b subunit
MRDIAAIYETSLGKKIVMALTGIILFIYVVGHMLGNLQIYLGPEQINSYAEFLHSKPTMLWIARTVLLAAVLVHFVAAVQLWLRNRSSRPVRYRFFNPPAVDYAARTMVWTGPIIALFVIYHVLHFTTGTVHPGFEELKPFHNVVVGFSNPWVAAFYVLANLLLAVHLYHGVWSLFQSLGWDHPRFGPWRRSFAVAVAAIIGAGNVSIPLAVLTGVVHL